MSFVFVLGVALASAASAADPDLVAWWKLDEGQGTIAADSSGNGYDGTLIGGVGWLVPGFIGGAALEFTGDGQYVAIKDLFYQGTDYTEITVCVWIRTDNSGTQYIASFDRNEYWRLEVNGSGGGPGQIGWDVYHSGGQLDYGSVTRIDDGLWHHVAGVYDNGTATIYIDGEAEPSATGGATWGRRQNVRYGFMGANSEATEFDGSRGGGDPVEGNIDDLRIYHRALSQTELRELGGFLESYNPEPADGVKYLDTWASLMWASGPRAVSHDVYFGDNFDDVNDGAESTFMGNQTATDLIVGFPGYAVPDGLVPGTTYYWRIDDIDADGAKINGDVWSFWIPPTAAYDPVPTDSEPFEDPNLVLSWSPGMNMIMHAVFFGTDANEVANAAGAPPHMETTYDPGLLTADTTYYWRVDTFNGAEWITGPLWSFGTMPVIPGTDDPNLVARWKLDEGAGTNALDASGHGNHGKLFGPQWSGPSWIGDSALNFAEDDASYVAIQNMNYSNVTDSEVTVTAWIRTSDPNDQYIASFDRNEYWRLQVNGEVATEGQVGWHVWTSTGQLDYGSITRVDDGFWHHVCGVFDNGQSTIFIDGLPEPSAFGGNTFGSGDETRFGFLSANSEATDFNGNRGDGSGISGDVADVRIYNKALTQDEIMDMMRVDPLMAWDLQPPTRTLDIENVPSSLTWRPGDNASQHDVYFGTDKDVVNNADTSDTSGIYRGRQAGTTYVPPDEFVLGQSYIWRIDELNTDGTITKGGVRAVIVPDFITIDDFERYDVGNNEIWWAWIDGLGYPVHPTLPPHPGNGTGSMVGDETTGSYTEETIVHGGRQAMPLFYDNSILRYSEVEMTLSPPPDWTKHNLDELSLWFQGEPNNAAESLYVALNGSAVVTHDNPDASLVEEWTEWNIKLQTFADQGVNLANISSIAIGLGNRNNPQAGGSGTIYIDDIRLYQPRPIDPGTDGLVAYYAFENDANDSSDNGLHGTLVGDPTYVEGLAGYGMALDFDGTDDLVELGKFDVVGQITLAAWIQADDFEINDVRVISKAKEWGGDDHWWMLSTISETSLRFRLKTDEGPGTATLISDPVLETGVWTHVVASWDGSMMRIYKDGVEVAGQEKGGSAVAVDPAIGAAIGSQPSDAFASDPSHVAKFFDGLIDEVRIYNRALSALEVRYLAGER